MVKEDKTKKTRIIVVDDHPIVRQGLSQLINHEPDLEVCAQAEDAPQAMSLIKQFKPDVAIVDISLKESSGMELIKDIKTSYPSVSILALSMHDESLYAERALRAGAKGYIMKSVATEKVVDAIKQILADRIYVSDKMSAKMMRKMVGAGPEVGASAIERLSDRELEVFTLIGQGNSTRKIAEHLHLSVKTIETYRAHIKEKLNLTDATELLQYAIRWVNSKTTE
ncbi:MAG: response regulator transcription factor [Sedimentisphaerales bacterium]|nr:response regulator transcription factor [Sedimentisphaerales bacterium]